MTNFSRCIFKLIIVLAFLLLFLLLGCVSKPEKDFNVVFMSLDTTRYDYIDTGRGAKAYTPQLSKFSEDAIVFENAFATSTQTLPSHLSVFTARYPYELGVYSNDDKYDGHYKMIQNILAEKSYRTAAIISLGTINSDTGTQKGFELFEENLFEKNVFFVPAEKITSEAIHTIQKWKKEHFFLFVHYSDPHTPYAPPDVKGEFRIALDGNQITQFNSYEGAIIKERISLSKGSHLLEFKVGHDMKDFSHFVIRGLTASEGCTLVPKHLDYSEKLYGGSYKMKDSAGQVKIQCEKESFVKIFQIIPILKFKSALEYYRLEVEYMDSFVGKLLRTIDEIGLKDNTIIAVFGDHGEGHGEKDGFFGHTRCLNRQFIHVPLIIKIPGYGRKRVSYPVSLVGLSPTILEYLEIQDQSFDYSDSFLDAMHGRFDEDKLIYSFAFDPPGKMHKFSIIKWPFQCIFYMEQGQLQKREYYNLTLSQSFSDKDAVHEETILKGSLLHYLTFLKESREMREIFYLEETRNKSLNKKDLEKLRALGYIHD